MPNPASFSRIGRFLEKKILSQNQSKSSPGITGHSVQLTVLELVRKFEDRRSTVDYMKLLQLSRKFSHGVDLHSRGGILREFDIVSLVRFAKLGIDDQLAVASVGFAMGCPILFYPAMMLADDLLRFNTLLVKRIIEGNPASRQWQTINVDLKDHANRETTLRLYQRVLVPNKNLQKANSVARFQIPTENHFW